MLQYMSEQNKQLTCASHLKEVAKMGFMYQEEHDGQFQPMIVRKRTWEYWPQYLKPYAKDFIHFSCPADSRRGAGAFEVDELLPRFYNAGYISYGMNYYLPHHPGPGLPHLGGQPRGHQRFAYRPRKSINEKKPCTRTAFSLA